MNFLKSLFSGKRLIRKTDVTRRFDLIARVGQGSMSKVWRARDSMTGKTVALKVLDKEKTKRLEARFTGLKKPTEGEVAVQLHHPGIVRTFEHGVTLDNEQFLIMEFVEGVGLSYLVDVQNDVMQENRLRFMIQLCKALSYFHKQNYIHRDICPRNVLVNNEHQVKLIDFGLTVPDTEDFRKPGNRTGTANYMAPELIKRMPTDKRIDIFSYAMTCYEMFTRRYPWEGSENIGEGDDTLKMVMQHINTPPKDIREYVSDIDDQVASIIMKGLETDPGKRWQTMDEITSELREAGKRLENIDIEEEEEFEAPA